MNVEIKHRMEITLTLTAKEAIWLKELVQNPQGNPHHEHDRIRDMRFDLFNALPSFPDLHQVIISTNQNDT